MSNDPKKKINIKFRTPQYQIYEVQAQLNHILMIAINNLCKKEGMNSKEIKLTYKGRILKPTEKISSLNYSPGDYIQILIQAKPKENVNYCQAVVPANSLEGQELLKRLPKFNVHRRYELAGYNGIGYDPIFKRTIELLPESLETIVRYQEVVNESTRTSRYEEILEREKRKAREENKTTKIDENEVKRLLDEELPKVDYRRTIEDYIYQHGLDPTILYVSDIKNKKAIPPSLDLLREAMERACRELNNNFSSFSRAFCLDQEDLPIFKINDQIEGYSPLPGAIPKAKFIEDEIDYQISKLPDEKRRILNELAIEFKRELGDIYQVYEMSHGIVEEARVFLKENSDMNDRKNV